MAHVMSVCMPPNDKKLRCTKDDFSVSTVCKSNQQKTHKREIVLIGNDKKTAMTKQQQQQQLS